jgi:hypothetical protein
MCAGTNILELRKKKREGKKKTTPRVVSVQELRRSGNSGLMPVKSSLLLSLVRRYFLELSLSTTGHDGSPWIL